MIRLVASDLDGTLLRSDRTLSERTVNVLTRLPEKGIVFVASTGRSFEAACRLVRKELKDAVLLTCNGAEVFEGDVSVISHLMDGEDCVKIRHILENTCAIPKFNGANDCYMTEKNALDILHDQVRRRNPNLSDDEVEKVPYFQDLKSGLHIITEEELSKLGPSVGKAFCMVSDKDAIDGLLEMMRRHPEFSAVSSGSDNIEISAKQANKGSSLLEYVKMKNISPDEVLVFGDSLNDRSMMEKGFHSVAMGNADPRIIDLADEVTLSNDEDGVAAYLEGLLGL